MILLIVLTPLTGSPSGGERKLYNIVSIKCERIRVNRRGDRPLAGQIAAKRALPRFPLYWRLPACHARSCGCRRRSREPCFPVEVTMVRRHAVIASGSILLALAFAGSAYAQDPPTEAETPAHISLVEGVAVLERDGSTDNAPANMLLLAGDRIRTRVGRVEILFADGSTLHLDHNSAIDLQSDELVRLLDGRVRLSIPARARDVSYRIDGPHAWAQISQPGEYRAAVIQNAGASELEFAVLRGSAELTNEGGRTTLRAGERAFARADAAPSHAYVFNSASWDPFDRWSEARRSERLACLYAVPPRTKCGRMPATLDRYGSWEYESSYGYVWYPRVDFGWRPYYHGRWSSLRPYGWTWIGSDPWGWPTHHYGRWGVSTARLVVLDSRALVGAGVGVVGTCAWLRELVPAWLQQPSGVPDRCRRPSRVRSLARVDGDPATRLRCRFRAPPRPRRFRDRRTDSQRLHIRRQGADHHRSRGVQRILGRTDSRRRHCHCAPRYGSAPHQSWNGNVRTRHAQPRRLASSTSTRRPSSAPAR